jgi:hypothetical protein
MEFPTLQGFMLCKALSKYIKGIKGIKGITGIKCKNIFLYTHHPPCVKGMKTTKFTRFLIQHENKAKFSFKFKS